VHFKIAGEIKGPYGSSIGLPQGCLSNTSLYNLYTTRLEDCISDHCEALSFADDAVLYFSSGNLDRCFTTMQENLTAVNAYFNSLGLTLAPEKCQLVVFSKEGGRPMHKSLTLQDITITLQGKAKFLGVWMDSQPNWEAQIHSLVQCCSVHVNIIRSLCTT